jgi:hypothetical protein
MKFKPGQLVRRTARMGDPESLYYVVDAQWPSMIVYCVESLFSFIQGQNFEVSQGEFELVKGNR